MLEFNIYVSTIAPGYIRTPMTNVNNFTMPFLINSDKAAKKIIRSIEKKARFTIIPFPMNIVGRIIRVLPCFLWDCLARNAPRKKRVSNKSQAGYAYIKISNSFKIHTIKVTHNN